MAKGNKYVTHKIATKVFALSKAIKIDGVIFVYGNTSV